ncbi:MAG: ABC transporter ATP-binding protein [Candidatus Bipolaricaulaceae bacterium]
MSSNSPDQQQVVRAAGLVKQFDGRSALDGLDLSVARGQLYGLVGPNGAGKTTLIRVLCGLLRADQGEAHVLGWSVPNFRIQSQIGYMPQEVALFPDLTVAGNLHFFGGLYDLPRRQLQARADDLLEPIQLTDRRRQKVGTLSGGMQRRVSLAVALLHKPQLLFLDEPTVGVDPQLRQTFWDHFADLTRREGTLIITTHIMDEAAHCHLVGFLSRGRLLAQGTPEELLAAAGTASLEEAFAALEAREGQP